jgi:Na+(H+)/acetate symporter ActP
MLATVPVLGLVLYKTIFRKKKSHSNAEFTKSSLVKSVTGLVVGLVVKPYIRKWAMIKVSDFITRRFGDTSSDKTIRNLHLQ